jgi:hypothetical protein
MFADSNIINAGDTLSVDDSVGHSVSSEALTKSIHASSDLEQQQSNDRKSSNGFDIAGNETKAVYRSKFLLLTVIAIAAASFGAATFVITRDEETNEFRNEVSEVDCGMRSGQKKTITHNVLILRFSLDCTTHDGL